MLVDVDKLWTASISSEQCTVEDIKDDLLATRKGIDP
jgi:hypothetical protein